MSTRSKDCLLFIFAFLSRVNKQELGLDEKGLKSPHSLYKLQTFLKTNLSWSTVALQVVLVSAAQQSESVTYIHSFLTLSLSLSLYIYIYIKIMEY